MAEASGWYRDGVDRDDPYQAETGALRALGEIDRNSPELVRVLSGWAWIFDDDMHVEETLVIEYIADLAGNAPGFVPSMVELPWISDGIEYWEASAASDLYGTALFYDLDFAVELATTPWVVDGVTFPEVLFGTSTLSGFAGQSVQSFINVQDGTSGERDVPASPELARQMMGLIGSPPSERDLFLLTKLNSIRTNDPDAFERLLMEPWFIDGLDEEERILLIAVGGVGSGDQLSEPHTVASATISLPHSGNVNLWAVWLGESHTEETILAGLEKAVRGSEQFMELPFPVGDVILYLEDVEECASKGRLECRGKHLGQMMLLFTYDGDPGAQNVYHEVAHYFFKAGPAWFTEGGAEYVRFYIALDGNVPAVDFPDYCAEAGINNLQALNDLGGGYEWDHCRYPMGLHFLATLRDTMGEDAWLAAMRAFYLEFGYEGLYVSTEDSPEDEEVYQAFMEHAPPELADEVRDVFRRLHGGPFVDAENQVQ